MFFNFNIKNLFNLEKVNFIFFNPGKRKSSNLLDKTTISILFIDDEKFPIVDNLHHAGWNTKRITDVKNLQDPQIIQAQIIFVDYEGVGNFLFPKEKGIGIVRALKETYFNTKRVILYSGHNIFPVDAEFEVADARLSKNSDLYEFIRIIESEIKKIK